MSQVVAITGALADAGLTAGAIAHWWSTERAELGGQMPRVAVLTAATRKAVIELARRDAEVCREH